MLAQVRKYRRKILTILFCAVAITFASCASQPVKLVDDPDDRGGSAMPWSHQEKWEMMPDANALGPTSSSDSRR
jgi:hypothetical protein